MADTTDQEAFAAELYRLAAAVETGHATVEHMRTYPFFGGPRSEVLLVWPSTNSTSPSPRTSS